MPTPSDQVPVAGRARRVVHDDPRPSFFTSAIDGAPRWAVGVLTAAQAVALSLLTLAVPAVAVFVATSADPANADVAWTRAVVVASNLWLLAHGVPVELGGAVVSVVPLGLTALALFTGYASARRSGVATRGATLAALGGYAALTVLVALVAGTDGGGLLRAALGGVLVGGAGLGLGLLRRPESPGWSRVVAPLRARCSPAVLVGVRTGVTSTAALVAVAALLTALWVLAGRTAVTDVVRGLSLDAVGGVVLAVAQLAFLPNLVVWAVAWLAGPGFAVGEGTRFAPAEVVAGPLPAFPLLGALPDATGGPLLAAPVVVVGVGVLAGLAVHRRLDPERVRDVWVAVGVVAVVSAVLVGLLVAVASGAVGPGRMAHVGAHPGLVGLLVGVGCGAGAACASVPFDPRVRAALRARRARRAAPGTAPDDAPD